MSHTNLRSSPIPAALLAVFLSVAACESGPTGTGVWPEVASPLEDLGYAWTGAYTGSGSGQVLGMPKHVDQALLAIWLDADSVRDDTCPRCLTVSLDTLFAVANVLPESPVALALSYDRDGLRYSLDADRYSASGSIANVVTVHFRVVSLSDGEAMADMTYLLERR